jgi:8-oxo-dGTP pyrophosphatase MutT (NUDIX family)
MTHRERENIREKDFDILWNEMWCRQKDDVETKNFTREFHDASAKFTTIKNGYYINTKDLGLILFNINFVIDNTVPQYDDTEWGFPKGRRNINENDLSCALREFKEETGIHFKSIKVIHDIKPIEEVFSGSNKVRYKHVYYVAKTSSVSLEVHKNYTPQMFNPSNKVQVKEVKDVKWFTYQEAMNLIREHNVERKEVLKRLDGLIMRTIQ